MVAAKEKMLRRETLLTQTKICAEPSRQPATTKTQNQPTTKTNSPTVVNRISSYDFTARKFQKPPIGSTEKIRCIVPLAARTKPRKNTGENLPHVRRLHRAPELSLYRAYFVPTALDPLGAQADESSGKCDGGVITPYQIYIGGERIRIPRLFRSSLFSMRAGCRLRASSK